MTDKPTALIIGASRGLGLAMAEEYANRGWHVIATARTPGTKLDTIPGIEVERLDITDTPALAALQSRLATRQIDLLFVNAGIANGPAETLSTTTTDSFINTMVTNALSPMRVIEALAPLVPPTGTIGVMSSGLGSVADNDRGGWEIYRASKAALNTLMRSFAARHPADPRAIIIIAPGWVKTDMGTAAATLTIAESIPRVVDVLTTQTGTPGLQYLNYQGQTVRW